MISNAFQSNPGTIFSVLLREITALYNLILNSKVQRLMNKVYRGHKYDKLTKKELLGI